MSRKNIEEEFSGGYSRIFPAENEDEYEGFMIAARDVWLSNLGIKKKKETPAPQIKIHKPIGTPRVYHHKSISPLFSKSIKHLYPPPKKTINKLPSLKLAYGTFVQPRLFDFNDSGHTIVAYSKEQEKQG